MAKKLVVEIDHSKKSSLNVLLPAFSIPLIGKTAAQKLSTKISDLSELTADKCKEAGLGPKATEHLLNWYFGEFLSSLIRLPFDFSFEKEDTTRVLKGTVCLSGRLKSFSTKADATAALVRKGYVVKSTITKDVTILVNESGIESAKTKQAQEKGIQIVTNLLNFLGE